MATRWNKLKALEVRGRQPAAPLHDFTNHKFTWEKRDKPVRNASRYLFIYSSFENKSSKHDVKYIHRMTWGWRCGDSHCVFFYASEWQTDSLSKRFGCVLGPKSTCLQRLHFSNTTSCRRVSLRVGWQSECVADARRKSSHSAWMLALTKRRRTLPFPYYMDFDTKGWSSTWLNCCFYEEHDVEHVGPMPQPPKQTTNRAATHRPARQEWHISQMDDLYCGYKANSHRTPISPRTQTKRAKPKVELGPVRTLGVGPAHAAEEGDLLKPKQMPEVGNL